MPTGHYKRTPEVLERAKKNLAKGRTPEARKKAADSIRRIAKNLDWRKRVSDATRIAMHTPKIRKRHLSGLRRAFAIHGSNFAGGNGVEPTRVVKLFASILEPFGFIRELPIKTAGHQTSHNAPDNYKADFGHPRLKIAIELDGPSHHNHRAKEIDQKKNNVLTSLGWTVFRISHK